MKSKYVKVVLSLCLAACAAGLCISLSSSHKEEPIPVPGRVQLRLNESLTNEISDASALAGMDKRIENYMRQWALRGTSLAIMRNDSLVYAKGYGWADKELDISMEPSHILIADIGKVIALTEDKLEVVGSVTAGRTLVDGLGVGDVGNIVIRDRQQLAMEGVVIVVMTLAKGTSHPLAGPDIVSRGFVYVRDSEELIREAHDRVAAVLERCEAGNIREWAVIKSQVRDTLSRYLYEKTRRRPMILPIIMEV